MRVCGPFSVESLTPHRGFSTADENQDGTLTEKEARKQQDFTTMILDNLKKAGVQNTRKGERLTFDRLDLRRGLATRCGRVQRCRQDPARGGFSRSRARHYRSAVGEGTS